MTEAEQLARSARFDGHRTVLVTDCGNGQFGVHQWGGDGAFLGIATAESLASLILNRPPYAYTPEPKLVRGINISDLDFNL